MLHHSQVNVLPSSKKPADRSEQPAKALAISNDLKLVLSVSPRQAVSTGHQHGYGYIYLYLCT